MASVVKKAVAANTHAVAVEVVPVGLCAITGRPYQQPGDAYRSRAAGLVLRPADEQHPLLRGERGQLLVAEIVLASAFEECVLRNELGVGERGAPQRRNRSLTSATAPSGRPANPNCRCTDPTRPAAYCNCG